MDLFAYSQIEDIGAIAEENGIEVPRLRGYRLMACEHLIPQKEIKEAADEHALYICERACTSIPRFRPNSCSSVFSWRTDRIKKKYCIYKYETEMWEGREITNKTIVGFRWDLIHGKNRKAIKFAIKKGKAAAIRQLETFNKYVGRKDVLYIHARIGGPNWTYWGGHEIEKQPWFLEKVDDYSDRTYCDIFALIKPIDDNREGN